MDKKKTNNPVAKHAKTFNKAHVMKDRKKAMKKGDMKHKGRYEDSGDIEERSTLDVISSVLRRGKDKSKYKAAVDAVKSGKYTLSKAAQVFGVRDKVLQDLVAEGNMKENGKGLWANIRAKRARGERPAKKGEKGYPKTLEIEGKNTPGDGNPCWDTHKKVGTKMKGGKRVNDCVPKNESMDPRDFTDKAGYLVVVKNKKGEEQIKNFFDSKPAAQKYAKRVTQGPDTAVVYKTDGRKMVKEAAAPKFNFAVYDKDGKLKGATSSEKDAKSHAFRIKGKVKKLGKPMKQTDIDKMMVLGMVGESRVEGPVGSDKHLKSIGKGQERNTADTMAALKNMQKNKKMREQAAASGASGIEFGPRPGAKKPVKVRGADGKTKVRMQRAHHGADQREGTSAQSRLDRAASKHGIGKTNNAADDFQAKMKAKHGEKGAAELKRQGDARVQAYMASRKESYNADHIFELTQSDLDAIAARKAKVDAKKSGKKVSSKANTKDAGGSGDDNLIMQLRKAQDLGGRMDIEVAKGKKTKLPKAMIDKLLKTYDKLRKPQDKKKFLTMVNHELRKKAGVANKPGKTASDKAMDKFNKTRSRGIPAPGKKDKDEGPTAKDLRNMR